MHDPMVAHEGEETGGEVSSALVVMRCLRQFEDGPRVRDTDLAEWLGYELPPQIRELITRNQRDLEKQGVLRIVRKTSGPRGGRPGTEYWLNEGQVTLVCMWSQTERAHKCSTW